MKRWSVGLSVGAALLMGACSNLEGLEVLTGGQEAATGGIADTTLVMADKTGGSNPAWIAAADRIEAAVSYLDVVEIAVDPIGDALTVYALIRPSGDPTSGVQQERIEYIESIRTAFELTWLGVMDISEGREYLDIHLLNPSLVTTINSGVGIVAQTQQFAEITRGAAIDYLAGPRNINTFIDLVVGGTLDFISYDSGPNYTGTPNHPIFMLPTPR